MIHVEFIQSGIYEDTDNSKFIEVIVKTISNAIYLLDESDYEVYVELTDNQKIQSINKDYRDIDKPTDVLSFPQFDFVDGEGFVDDDGIDPETGFYMLGDIIISLDKAKIQAEEYGHDITREVAFLAIHGFLHLLGFDHDNKEREALMLQNANKILEEAGYTREYV